VKWTSDKDGVIGNTTPIDYIFGSPGTRKITVTAKDQGGKNASDSIAVTVKESTPSVQIIKPTAGQALYTGVAYVFQGTSFDQDTFGALPCSKLVWTSNTASDYAVPYGLTFPRTGCTPTVMFVVPGPRTITLNAANSSGLAAQPAKVNISVLDPPPNAAPIATILNPTPNQDLDPDAVATLKGGITAPGNSAPISYKWVVKEGGTETVIGSGSTTSGQAIQTNWKPSATFPYHPGGWSIRLYLYGTTSTGAQASSYVDVHVPYPPA
jgi:hypothetical protein